MAASLGSVAVLDLLIEAEHGFDSAALLVTYCEDFAEKALGYLGEYLEKLPP